MRKNQSRIKGHLSNKDGERTAWDMSFIELDSEVVDTILPWHEADSMQISEVSLLNWYHYILESAKGSTTGLLGLKILDNEILQQVSLTKA